MQKLFSQSSNMTRKSISVSMFHKTTHLNLAPASPQAQPQRRDGGLHTEHCSVMLQLRVPPSISAQEDIRQGQAAHPRPSPYYPFASSILRLTIWMRRRIVGWGTCSIQTILGGRPESKCLSSKSQFSLHIRAGLSLWAINTFKNGEEEINSLPGRGEKWRFKY